MNKKVLKQTSILSIFLGTILGIITLIPFIGNLAFWLLMCFASTAIIIFMTKFEILEIKTVQESSILGAIIGFISFLGFSIFYIPSIMLLSKVFGISSNYGVSMALNNASFGIIIAIVIFMGVLSATINAFSGFLTYYGIDFYKSLNKDEEHFKLK